MSGVARRVAAVCLAVALGAGAIGCGDDAEGGGSSVGTTLTIYSSLPLQGPWAAASQAIVNGEKLALAEAGGQVGEFTVKYVSLDDSTARSGGWDAGQAAKNARAAVQDRTTIAYLGDFDAGATAITLPTLNEAGILQITPATTLVGLTRSEGADKGEPEKYYPAGRRTFGRVVPADHVQAAAQISLQQAQGCRASFLLHGSEAYGKSLADLIELGAPGRGLRVAGNEAVDPEEATYADLVREVTTSGADCVFFGGVADAAAVRLFRAVHAALPRLRLFVPNGLATPRFAAALGPALERVTHLTSPGLASRLYPPAGRSFLRRYRTRYAAADGMYAMYGYEAMRAALLAIARAGSRGNEKQAVVEAFFAIRGRRSVLGTYSVDPRGDTTLNRYGAYRVRGGRLVFDRVIPPAAG